MRRETEKFILKICSVLSAFMKDGQPEVFSVLAGPGEVPSLVLIPEMPESPRDFIQRTIQRFFADDRTEFGICTMVRDIPTSEGNEDRIVIYSFVDGKFATSIFTADKQGYKCCEGSDSDVLMEIEEEVSSFLAKMD